MQTQETMRITHAGIILPPYFDIDIHLRGLRTIKEARPGAYAQVLANVPTFGSTGNSWTDYFKKNPRYASALKDLMSVPGH